MKNKKRLAVLAMSAVMAMTSMPFSAFAADFSAGEGVDSAITADAETTEADAEALDVADEEADAASKSETQISNLNFEYSWTDKVATVTYVRDGEKVTLTSEKDPKLVSVSDPDPATCDGAEGYGTTESAKPHGERVTIQANILGTIKTSEWIYNPNKLALTAHKWKETDRKTINNASHTSEGEAKVTYTCQVCGATKTEDEPLPIDPTFHTWSSETLSYISYADTSDKAAVAAAEDRAVNSNLKYTTKTIKFTNGDETIFYIVDFDTNGKPQLKNISKGASYDVGRYCTVDGELQAPEKKTVKPEAERAVKAVIIAQSEEIKTNLVDNTKYYLTTALPLNEDDIELYDCTKGGSYTVSYYDEDNNYLGEKKIEVSAHHYHQYKTAVFASQLDADQCTVTTEKDGSLTVKNKSCYLPVDYEEVTHCSAEGCNLDKHVIKSTSVEKDGTDEKITTHNGSQKTGTVVTSKAITAEPAGDHVICTDAKREVKTVVSKLDERKHAYYTGHSLYDQLVAIAEKCKAGGYGERYKGEYVTVSAAPDCEKGGYVTVSYICVVDKKTVVETEQVYIAPDKHEAKVDKDENTVRVIENEVKPTCSASGSYDLVTYCKYCGAEMNRESKKVLRLKHSNETSVNDNGTGNDDRTTDKTAYIDFSGVQVVDYDSDLYKGFEANKNASVGTIHETKDAEGNVVSQRIVVGGNTTIDKFKYEYAMVAELKTNCSVCKNHVVTLDNGLQTKIDIKIVDIEKQKSNGEPGSITLKATYTRSDGTVATQETTVDYYSTIEAYASRVVSPTKTGINLDSDGVYRYYVNGEFQKDYDGIQAYGGEKFIVVDGVVPVTDKAASGLIKWIDGTWYFLSNARIRSDYTGPVNLRGEMFYVTNGILDTSVTDLVDYYGATVLFTDGRRRSDVSGLWQDPKGTWWYLREGQVQTWLTGEYTVNGRTVTVEGGMVVKG